MANVIYLTLIYYVCSNVDVTMNNMQYQCVFTLLSGDIESSVGVLRVIGNADTM